MLLNPTTAMNNANYIGVVSKPSNFFDPEDRKGGKCQVYSPKLPPSRTFRTLCSIPLLMKDLMLVFNKRTTSVIWCVRIDKSSGWSERHLRATKSKRVDVVYPKRQFIKSFFRQLNLRVPWLFLIYNGVQSICHDSGYTSNTRSERPYLAYHRCYISNFQNFTVILT